MSQLLACPFCRELFDRAEGDHCPECELRLRPLHRLGPSREAVEADAARWERGSPEDERRAFHDPGRGRGVLAGVALASLGVFGLAPWVSVTAPYTAVRSGYSLAQGPLGRRRGYATLHFGIAGGSLSMSGLPLDRARTIARAVLDSAAAVDFSDLPR